jgi:DNA-binding NarL/FixJ family response regulator
VLTPRERAILALAAQGRTTRQIAARLRVQLATVKAHLHTLYRKLGVSDRTSAVASALRRGLLK